MKRRLTLAERRAVAERIIRVSPWLSLAALSVVIATLFVNKLFPLALIASPPLGLGLYASSIWSWKTGNAWLPLVAAAPLPILGGQAATAGGLLWGVPQSLALVILFAMVQFWASGPAVLAWLHTADEQ